MVQHRPYRAGLSADAALAFLQQLARQGRVDVDAVATLAAHLPEAHQAASGQTQAAQRALGVGERTP